MPVLKKENHCPCGCQLIQLDDLGYCRHLLGFTNDGESVEPVRPVTKGANGRLAGDVFVDGKHPVRRQPGDIVVNPESQVLDQGVVTTKKEWVSARVYRPDPKPDAPKAKKGRKAAAVNAAEVTAA